jgi:hypothetical protein
LEFVKCDAWTKMAVDGQAHGHVFEPRESGDEFMSNLVRPCIALWPLRVMSWTAVICSAVVNCATLHAEPVTFRFDAEIVNVPIGNPFDLPLTYQVGDIIQGKFTFEPTSAKPIDNNAVAANQAFALEFNINGSVVGSSSFRIEVFNDTAFDDSNFPAPIDVITLGCNEPSCIPGLISLPGGEPFRVRSRSQFVGSSSILDMPEFSDDPTTWNAFLLERRLFLGFDDVGLGSMGLDAIVGQMFLVPEPSSSTLIIAGIVAVVATATWVKRRSNPRERAIETSAK